MQKFRIVELESEYIKNDVAYYMLLPAVLEKALFLILKKFIN